MAKIATNSNSFKIVFGRKKLGKAKKRRNKHDKTSKVYRGQGK